MKRLLVQGFLALSFFSVQPRRRRAEKVARGKCEAQRSTQPLVIRTTGSSPERATGVSPPDLLSALQASNHFSTDPGAARSALALATFSPRLRRNCTANLSRRLGRVVLRVLVLLLLSATYVRANVSLPDVIGNGMVLQQKQRVSIWGKADPGETVIVRFAGQSKKTSAAPEANGWSNSIRCALTRPRKR